MEKQDLLYYGIFFHTYCSKKQSKTFLFKQKEAKLALTILGRGIQFKSILCTWHYKLYNYEIKDTKSLLLNKHLCWKKFEIFS